MDATRDLTGRKRADLQAAIAQATAYQDRYEDAIAKISEEENDRIVAVEARNDQLQRALSEANWEKGEYQLEVQAAREEVEEKTQDLRALQRKHASVIESLRLLEARTEELEALAQLVIPVIPVKASRTTTDIPKGDLTFSRSSSVVYSLDVTQTRRGDPHHDPLLGINPTPCHPVHHTEALGAD
jgi:hypothetical protein